MPDVNAATKQVTTPADADYVLGTVNDQVRRFPVSSVRGLQGPQGPSGPKGDPGDASTFSLGASNPNLAPDPAAGAWSLTGTVAPTQIAGRGLVFSGASNLAAASYTGATLKDNTTYDVVLTLANYVGGKAQVMIYGPTAAHLGQSAEFSANGTYTFQVTTSAAGTVLNTIRVRATGVSTGGGNTFDVATFTVKEATSYPSRNLGDKIKEMQVSVIDFGADPTGAADSTAAFNSAIGYGARRVYVPAGTYKVTNLVVNKNVEIYGDGRDRTVIQVTGSGAIHGMQIIGDSALGKSNLIGLREFQLRYTGTGQTVAGAGPGLNNWSGIYIQRKVDMRHVYVRGFTNDGIYFAPSDANESTGAGGTIGEAVFFAEMSHVWSKENGRDGIAVRRGANANVFNNCQWDKNKRYGFHHYTDGFATYGNNIRDGQASYNSQEGYYWENGTNLTTSGLYAEYNGSPTNTNTDGYTNTTYDFYVGDNCVRSWIGIGVLFNANTARVRLPGFNSNQIQIWEGGRKLFGDT